MLAVILAGGRGSRLLEETRDKPKALVRIGDKPIIEHIMEGCIRQGIRDFLILTGYKSELLEAYFCGRESCGTVSRKQDCLSVELPRARVRLLDTGEDTGTARRLTRARPYIGEETFLLTYCDGLCSVRLDALADFHRAHHGLVTLTAVRPVPRYGVLELGADGTVTAMREKDRRDAPLINGGFMLMEPAVFQFVKDTDDALERDLLTRLAAEGGLKAYYHDGFWQCMDTLPEKERLCELWTSGKAPWVIDTADDGRLDHWPLPTAH